MPEGALTSFTVCDAYYHFAGQALLMTSQSRSIMHRIFNTNGQYSSAWLIL